MATATNPLSKPQKSTTLAAKWRAKTNYRSKRFTGYAPISFAMVVEAGRLTAGKATQLLYVILTASLGQFTKPDEAFMESAVDLKTSDLAELCGCDERTIQRELGDLARRKVIIWDQSKKGVNNVKPLFRTWESLPDYKPGPVGEPVTEDEPEPEPEDAKKDATVTKLTAKPVHVGAGKTSKPIKVECGVESISFATTLDADFSAVVEGGRLLVSAVPKWEPANGVNGLLQTNGIDEKPRQGCRGFVPTTTPVKQVSGGQSSQKGRGAQSKIGTSPVQHPRAGELSELLDPFLLRSCQKSLSGDLACLQSACDAIEDVPHDWLVKAVVERAARPINSPRTAVLILREITHNWRKTKDLPPGKRDLTAQEIKAMVDEDKRILAEKRKAIAEETRRMRAARIA